MSWLEIGAIGELKGALGLFVSFTFVAYAMKLKREDDSPRVQIIGTQDDRIKSRRCSIIESEYDFV